MRFRTVKDNFINDITSQRARNLYNDLKPDHKRFVQNYTACMAEGLGRTEAVKRTWSELKDASRGVIDQRGYITLNDPDVYEFLCAYGEQALDVLGQSLQSSVAYYLERSMTAEEILTKFAGCELEATDEGEILPWVENFSDIPQMWRKYVERIVKHESGIGWFVIPRDLYDSKTRAKMRENLDKITGNNVERIELLNVGVNTDKVLISDNDSLETVVQRYRKALGQ